MSGTGIDAGKGPPNMSPAWTSFGSVSIAEALNTLRLRSARAKIGM
jgi:hypothetical protein